MSRVLSEKFLNLGKEFWKCGVDFRKLWINWWHPAATTDQLRALELNVPPEVVVALEAVRARVELHQSNHSIHETWYGFAISWLIRAAPVRSTSEISS